MSAILLKLYINKNIAIQNNQIVILKENNLHPSEIKFIENLKNNKKYDKRAIKLFIREGLNEDIKNCDLFNSSKTCHTMKLFEKSHKLLLILWFINFVFFFLQGDLYNTSTIGQIVLCVTHFSVLAITVAESTNKLLLVKTEQGNDIQAKLLGLKNYLEDFSNIKNKDVEDITLWEYYIIYAIIFDLKGNLNQNSYILYNTYLKKH